MKDLLFIEAEDLLKEKVGNWSCEIEGMSGCLVWDNPESEIIMYGTPNWEDVGMGATPFEYTDEDGEYNQALVIEYVSMKGDLEAQKKYYLESLEFVLKNLKLKI